MDAARAAEEPVLFKRLILPPVPLVVLALVLGFAVLNLVSREVWLSVIAPTATHSVSLPVMPDELRERLGSLGLPWRTSQRSD